MLKERHPSLVVGLAATAAALLNAAGTASNKDQNSRDQRQGSSSEDTPNGRTPAGIDIGGAPGVDSVLDDLKASKVAGHGDDGSDKGQEGEEGGDKGAEEAGAQAEQEGQESKTSSDRVQDEHSGQNLGAIAIGFGKGELGSLSQGSSRIIADMGRSTIISSTATC